MKLVTILFLRDGERILLAMKKRGFGAGKWNGTGGKVESGEDIPAAAIRETQEEIGVTPIDLKLVGTIKFYEKTDPTFGHHAHIYLATKWQGQPAETEEMRPKWFNIKNIPYNDMWADDQYWLPMLLAGKIFQGTVTLDGERIAQHDIKVIAPINKS
jgi:8-oxo-dGTP pyrophosphatase MutT (NUDIX family)